MSRSQPNIPASPILGILAFIVLAIAGLLMIAERAGLPTVWGERIAFAVIVGTLILTAVAGRTVRESYFFAYAPFVTTLSGGAALAASIVGATSFLLPAKTPAEWLAVVWGASIGVIAVHVFLRLQNKTGSEKADQAKVDQAASNTPGLLLALRGAVLVLLGCALAAACLAGMGSVLLQTLDLASWKLSALILIIPVFSMLFGGLRGSITLSGVLALFAIVGLGAMIGTGLVTLGDLPLPGLTEPNMLFAVQEARARWALFMPPFFETWPALSGIFSGDALRALAVSTVVSAAISASLTPAVPVRRRSLTLVTVVIICLLPVAIMAVGGYAIETAALKFIGATVIRPPVGLLEATRLGLASVCGGYPETAEALRLACGVSPRDAAAVLGWEQVKISQEFLRSGLPVAQGYPTVISIMGRCVAAALALSGVTIGLWIAAKGLGQDIFARRQNAPGLASFRLALTRLAICLLAGGLLVLDIQSAALQQINPAVVAGFAAMAFLGLEATIHWTGYRQLKQSVENDAAQSKSPRKKRQKPQEHAANKWNPVIR